MARIMAIDWGTKRIGLAVSDPEQIIATGLTTVHIKDVHDFIKQYVSSENVSQFVVGEPKELDNSPSEIAQAVEEFITYLNRTYPNIPVSKVDERFTSRMAEDSIKETVKKKSQRRDKAMIDEVSATIILQSYMAQKR